MNPKSARAIPTVVARVQMLAARDLALVAPVAFRTCAMRKWPRR